MIRFPILVAVLFGLSCATAPRPAPSAPTERRYQASAGRGEFKFDNVVDLGDVNEENLSTAFQQVHGLAKGGAHQITIRIDSFGGSIILGYRWGRAVEDLKKGYGFGVTCIVDGAAYSMAAVLLESPLCDRRLATNRSTILFHNGSSGARGTAEDLISAAAFLEALNQAMGLVVSERLGITLAEYRARIAHADWVMATPEALHLKVIDALVSPNDIAPPAEG